MIGHMNDREKKIVKSDLAKNAAMRVLIGPKDGWDSHVMRVIELDPEGYSPKHSHDWPHINYVIEGEGALFLNGEKQPLTAGSIAYVPANELHQFTNEGDVTFKFMCIVPKKGHH